MQSITEDCLKKCVKPQAKMDSKITDCLNSCVDRWVETVGLVSKAIEEKKVFPLFFLLNAL
jgi:hypothetical protein